MKSEKALDFFMQNQIECRNNEPLSGHTTFKVGGPADYFVLPENKEQLSLVWHFVKENNLPCLVLGMGANLLVSDEGFRGIVLCLKRMDQISLIGENTIAAQAGASLHRVCSFAAEKSLSGLEFAYGIPATVGGAVYMNAGAYSGEICDVLIQSEHISPSGETGCFSREQLQMGYRHSLYQACPDLIISEAVFELKLGNRDEIRAKMAEILALRKEKQPLDYPSAGSTFKRPKGAFAGSLIEQCGLKGCCFGGAEVSEKHAGFIINKNRATAKDICALIEQVQKEVLAKTGYTLECEVKIIR